MGARLTLRHFVKSIKKRRLKNSTPAQDNDYFEQETGIVTLQYPQEKLPVPEVGRYQLHVEMDDCIVCDKCAKICPVNCIDIESVKASEQIGITSDGTPIRLYATKFDIDMAKCCFCGLCTTVCPTECITMTNVYDYSVFNMRELNFEFSKMTAEEVEKVKNEKAKNEKAKIEASEIERLQTEEIKAETSIHEIKLETETSISEKPAFKPKFKPIMKK